MISTSYAYEPNQLNPNAPEFVPSNHLHFSPPQPPQPPPPHSFVTWYTAVVHHHHHRRPKPSFHHHPTTTKRQTFVTPGPNSGLLPTPSSPSNSSTSPRRRWRRAPPPRHFPRQPPSSSRVWVEKAAVDPPSPTPVSYYPFENSTSLMIRHIPSRLSREELLKLLDEHCREENEKLKLSNTADSVQPPSEYDFLYLPVDFRRKGNLGYAFVNFTTWEGAARLFSSWKGSKWENSSHSHTRKICQICRAKFQGREALKRHFERSVFHCETDEYLPVEISPARNGCNSDVTNLVIVGTRVSRPEAANKVGHQETIHQPYEN